MANVRTHRFKGVKYYIELDKIDGWCDKPKKPQKSEYPAIRLPDGLPRESSKGAKLGLITLLHECIHAEHWALTETRTDQIATDIGTLLWRLGYRRKK